MIKYITVHNQNIDLRNVEDDQMDTKDLKSAIKQEAVKPSSRQLRDIFALNY